MRPPLSQPPEPQCCACGATEQGAIGDDESAPGLSRLSRQVGVVLISRFICAPCARAAVAGWAKKARNLNGPKEGKRA